MAAEKCREVGRPGIIDTFVPTRTQRSPYSATATGIAAGLRAKKPSLFLVYLHEPWPFPYLPSETQHHTITSYTMRYDQLHHQYHDYHRNQNQRSCQEQPQQQPLPVNMPHEFTYFPKLPPEIRTMVWEYSLPESRVYEVLDAPKSRLKTPAQQGLMFANVNPEPPPALAAVCRESRYFVLHQYKPLTLGRTTKYVDLSRDILLLEPYLLVKRLYRTLHFMSRIPLVRDNINRLALGTSYGVHTGICHPVLSWKVSKFNVSKMLSCLSKFPRLETLVFIVHQEFRFEFDFSWPNASPNGHLPAIPSASTHGHGLGGGLSTVASTSSTLPSVLLNTNLAVPFSNASAVQGSTGLPSPPPSLSPSPQPPSLALAIPPLAMHQPPAPPALPAQQPALRSPQLVHQAYRFKFDIEANINRTPRRPHLNELLYYPLDVDEDSDDWDLNDVGPDDENEWFDPWPTNDDWRRFRKRFLRAVCQSLETDSLGAAGCKWLRNKGGGREGGAGNVGTGSGGGGGGSMCSRPGEEGGKKKLPIPALQGASLLWRYTEGGYV